MDKAQHRENKLCVEVAYANPSKQKIISVTVNYGETVYGAAKKSCITEHFPEIDLDTVKIGLFGKVVPRPREKTVKSGDRIEIYRPLIADPREIRKKRAERIRRKQQSCPP